MPRLIAVLLTAFLLLAATAGAQKTRIWNGQPTALGEYPWSVALVDPDNPSRAFCGGTLISTTTVLTAAHCTIGTPADEVGVVAGVADITGVTTASASYFAVDAVSLHPQAVVEELQTRRDLSILTLDAPVVDPNAEPITIGDETTGDITTGLDVIATGWGTTDPNGPGADDTVKVKRFVEVDVVDDTVCQGQYATPLGAFVFDPADQVCASRGDGDPETDAFDTCGGDSGGPLVKQVGAGDDVTSAADWELVGTTSWGIGCAAPDDNNPGQLYPGVYARSAGAQLRPYAISAVGGTDPNPEQPELLSGEPDVFTDDPDDPSYIACAEGDTDWSGDIEQIDYLIRRDDGASYQTVSDSGIYGFDAGDAGESFVCELRAKNPAAGGYGVARSDALEVAEPAPSEPDVVEVPGPPVYYPVPVPSPPAVQTIPFPVAVPVPQPRVNDTTPPKVSKVSRKCTKQRRCTFTVTASDARPSAGVTALNATATTIRARSCRKKGRRTTCASVTSRELSVRRNASGTFTVTTPTTLPKGTHTLVLVAADGNGNVMAKPYRASFTVR